MPNFTILSQSWVKENYRLKPALRSLFVGVALLFGLALQALANTINVPADHATISAAVAAAAAGDVIIVGPGTYNENVNVNLNDLTIKSSGGAAATTIQGIAGNPGTIHIMAGVNGVTIGGVGAGFTIIGFDGPGNIERGAIYMTQGHTNIHIIGNIIQADGEHGLVTEYNAAIDGIYITDNTFSGKTFVGAEPGGCGFGTQNDPGNNVPRQLVVMGGGAGVTNSKNVFFINNQITGTAGGFNTPGSCEQGNTLVTIDVIGATISGNTFNGTTTATAGSLRTRGKETSIFCNTFNTTGLGANCYNILFGAAQPLTSAQPNTLAGVASTNAFPDGGAYLTPNHANSWVIFKSVAQADAAAIVIGAGQTSVAAAASLSCPVTNSTIGAKFTTIQLAVSAPCTKDGHTITVDAGTYAENVTVNKELDIRGPNYNVSPNGGMRVAEAIVVPAVTAAGGEIFMVKKSNVSINGFTIDGDNPLLNSTWIGTNGADIDAAEGVTIYDAVPVVNNLNVSNNIIQNLGYFGVTLYGKSDFSDANTSKTGHVISNNLIRNLGYYGTGNGFDKWGGGVLLYNSHYASVEDNVMTNVRIGIQTGNFQAAHTGDPEFQVIDNNQIQTRYSGMFFNLHNYSPWTISGNTITGIDNATEAAGATRPWRGMLIASLGNGMGSSTFSNNTIDGSGITLFTTGKEGINVWNVESASAADITEGSISGVITGIFLNNFEGYATNASKGAHATISEVNINASGTGIRLLDSPSSTSHANVQATVTNCFITGGTDGALLEETVANKVLGVLNNNSITGQSGDAIIATTLNTTVDATCNWYGSSNSTVVDGKIQGNVDWLSFLTNGTDDLPGTSGFQPVAGSCNGVLTEFFVNDNSLTGDIYTSAVGNDANPGTPSAPMATVAAAISAASAGHTIKVDVGSYNQEFDISKDLTLQGAGMDVCTISGPIGGVSSTIKVSASGVIIEGFKITRDGNNAVDWTNPNLNSAGIAIQGQTVDAEVKNCELSGNRTGIDINNSNDNNVHNNIITLNRTGLVFRNQTDYTTLTENEITDNYTLGIVFLDASSGSNSPVQSALNSNFNENKISGNWYGQVVDRQTGGSLPLPGDNLKNFECNWFGSASPVTSNANSSEPGGNLPHPIIYGGSDNPPVPGPEILGAASANIDHLLYLIDGTDNESGTDGFQPTPLSCQGGCPGGGVVINENSNGIYCSIQDAINAANSGDRLKVKTGTYTENVDATASGKNLTFAPGNSPGCVTINGDYTLNAGDELEMEVEGTTPCTQHDQLIVNGVVTLNDATLTLPPSMYLALDGDVIVLIDNDGADAVVGRFAEGNFASDGQNSYYINYEGGDGNDVELTKCCGALVDLGLYTTTLAPNPTPPSILAGHKLVIKAKPTKDMVNAIYTQGTFTLRTATNVAMVNFSGDNVHSDFGYAQIGMKQTIGGFDYFIFNFENGNPTPINWLEGVEYDLLTLTYSCAVGDAIFDLVTNPTDPNAPVSGAFYQEINGETNPGAQGVFYTLPATGPAVLAISASSNSPVCQTMDIDLNSTTLNGSTPYAPYAWSGPSMYTSALADPIPFVATLVPVTAGIYTVSVTDGNGCTATGTTSVSVPATGACVKNENTVKYYPTIQQAIDAALTDNGHVLTVPAKTWPEAVVVDKELTLNGANMVPCTDPRGAESIIKGGAGTAVTISADKVTINGFQIEGNTGISSTLNDGITIINNKVFAAALGIGTVGVSTVAFNSNIEDNCVDMTSHVFADFTFSSNPALATSQSPPGAWYTDRYAPAGFVSESSRLKHSISAADCEGCRPGAFNSAFYNTQGRKFDITGATTMSIELYVPSDWATTGRRMAGLWGTAYDAGNAISFYPIFEFTSDAATPRFRVWNNGVWIDKGLPTGFVYDAWYTMTISISGSDIVYTVGDLTESVPALGSLTLANVILQGHNTVTPGVTYDIQWDNFTSNSPLVSTTNVPSVGIALLGANGTNAVTIQDNSVADGFYGHLLSGVSTTTRTSVKGGTHTNLLQGVAVVNTTNGVSYAPSTVGIEDMALESFGGDYPHLPAANFHSGIYAFTGGSNPNDTLNILVNNVTVKNTGNTAPNSAGLHFADFSSGAGIRLNASVTASVIESNKNRGVQIRGGNAKAQVSTSNILGNGGDPHGLGGNNGFGVYAGVGSYITLLNNFITNPATQTAYNVTALFEGVAPASTIVAHENSIDQNGNGELTATTTGSMNATCNWWGSSYIDVIDADVDGNVTFIPYLNAEDDSDMDPNNGFQPSAPCVNPKRWYVNDNALVGDIYTSAVGNDLNQGTKRRPFLTIGKAINTVVSTDTIYVDAGGYDEQSVVPATKDNLLFQGAGLPTIVDFTGTASSEKTLFRISGENTTIDGFKFNVDLTKLHMAINASDASLENITIKNNTISPYQSTPGTYLASYGPRNAISVNLTPSTNFGGVDNVVVDNNIVTATVNGTYLGDLPDASDIGFRSAVAVDNGSGTFTRNTFQAISHDIIVRYNLNGTTLIGGSALNANTFNGGGVQISGQTSAGPAGLGTNEVSYNTFDGSVAGVAATPGSVLRLQNNNRELVTTVKNNTFNNLRWGMSVENYRDITVMDNTFNPLAGYTTFRHITVNTKCLSTNSPLVNLTTISGTYTGNIFNSLTPTVGGTAISFYNHDAPATIGTFTVGGAGALANVFAKDFTYAALMSDKTGNTLDHPDFPEYSTTNLGLLSNTTMACWDKDINLSNNTFDVGSGQKLPANMTSGERATLEGKLYHKPDALCLGSFFPTISVMAKVFLQGPYDPVDGRMGDALRVNTLIPTATTPYTQIEVDFPGSFVKVNNSVVESITLPGVLGVTDDNAIVDWIWLELRDKDNHNTVLFTRSALLQRDGDIVDLDGTSAVSFPNAYEEEYYLMVRHRNHLAAMTATPVADLNIEEVDFTDPAEATFGTTPTSARRLVKTGIYGLWAGNTYPKSANGFQLKYNGSQNDRAQILNVVGNTTPLNVVTGYYLEDVNMNSQVKYSGSNNDRVIILNNVGASTPLNIITQQPNN